MGLRPARIYRKLERPYTRTSKKVHKKAFIKGVPGSKVVKFTTGNQKGDFDLDASLSVKNDVQVRHNALEAARICVTAYMRKNALPDEYFIKIRVVPHHVLKEHAQAAVAQADRFYDGMAHPFGKPSGTAARLKKNQRVITVSTKKKNEAAAREALRRAGMKLPCGFNIEVEEF